MDPYDGGQAEAVGYQAHDPTRQEHPEMVLDNLVNVWSPMALGVRPRCGRGRGSGPSAPS